MKNENLTTESRYFNESIVIKTLSYLLTDMDLKMIFTFNATGFVSIQRKGAIRDKGLEAETIVIACTTRVISSTDRHEC